MRFPLFICRWYYQWQMLYRMMRRGDYPESHQRIFAGHRNTMAGLFLLWSNFAILKTMSVTLYRKYRPADFSEIIGQEQVSEVLAESVKRGNIVHAYLFAGPRGTGKTSVARILARAVGTTSKDLFEIDGASNRGIDEIRTLREAVSTLPFESKYKVYIIDEVHMLTKDAFNALLKTLEEPPAHVIFILATTELSKVLDTIVSRCQTFQFKKPTQAMLAEFCRTIAKKEGFTVNAEAADLVAFMGDGSFRDTAGILQKIIGYSSDKNISLEEVTKITGAPPFSFVYDFVSAINENDLDAALNLTDKAVAESFDLRLFLKLTMREIRFALLMSFSPKLKERLTQELAEAEIKFLLALAGRPGSVKLPAVLRAFLDAYPQIGASSLPQIPIELALIGTLSSK